MIRSPKETAPGGAGGDLPDTPALEQRFGRPPAARGESSFPQLRLLTLTETGTHAIFAAAVDRHEASEVRWHRSFCSS